MFNKEIHCHFEVDFDIFYSEVPREEAH